MRIKGLPDQVLKPGGTGPGILPGGGGDFIHQIRRVIGDFKELIGVAKDFQTMVRSAGEGGDGGILPQLGMGNPPTQTDNSPAPGGKSFGLKELAMMLIQQGHGDTPIGDLLDQIRPYSLNQLLGVFQKSAKAGKVGKSRK